MNEHDWSQVHRKLRRDRWFKLGTELAYTTAEAIRSGSIKAMADVEVRTRDNIFDTNGKRWCTIYLKIREDS